MEASAYGFSQRNWRPLLPKTLAAVLLAALLAWDVPAMAGGAIDFQVIHPQIFPPSNGPSYRAIRSRDEFAKLWGASSQVPSLNPAIDFNRYTLLIADAGGRPSSGYSLVFTGVIEGQKPTDESLTLTVSVLSLHPNCGVLTVLTHPLAFSLIPRTDKPIEFIVYEGAQECNAPPTRYPRIDSSK